MTISLSINSAIAPSSLSGCLINGVFDIEAFTAYHRQQTNENEEDKGNTVLSEMRLNRKRKMEISELQRKRSRSVKKHKVMVRSDDDTLREFTIKDTLWYLLYIATPPRNKRLAIMFRSRFRLPYSSFIGLHKELIEDKAFGRYTVKDAAGSPPMIQDYYYWDLYDIWEETLHMMI